MSAFGRSGAVALLFILLLVFAWEPMGQGGLFGSDFRHLAAAQGARHAPSSAKAPDANSDLDQDAVRGLGPWSLKALRLEPRAARPDRSLDLASPAVRLRLGNLVLLLVAGWMWHQAVRRSLRSWCGDDHARAAGWAASLLLCVHPIMPVALAGTDGRGPALFLALASACAAAFLSGRQTQRVWRVALSVLLAVLAGATSRSAFVLPVALAAVEYASSRRYRPRSARLRTALVTLCVVLGAVCFGRVCAGWLQGERSLRWDLLLAGEWGMEPARWLRSLERLGFAALPVNEEFFPAWSLVPLGLALLIGLAPALQAARTAPRLWAWLALVALVGFLALEWSSSSQRVHASDLGAAASLAIIAIVPATVLAVCSTALTGMLRMVLPLVLGLVMAVLSRGNALAVQAAGLRLAPLGEQLSLARLQHGAAEMLVLDPPGPVGGIDPLRGALPWMVMAPFDRSGIDQVRVQLASSRALVLLARASSDSRSHFAARRERGLVLLRADPTGAQFESWRAYKLSVPAPSAGSRSWFHDLRSPASLDLEPQSAGALLVRAGERSDTTAQPILGWRASGGASETGKCPGVWQGGGDVPRVVFDLSNSLDWLLAGRVRQLWLAQGIERLEEAQVLTALDPVAAALEPLHVNGDQIAFEFDADAPAQAAGESTWSLEWIELESLHHLAPTCSASSPAPGRVRLTADLPHALRTHAPLSSAPDSTEQAPLSGASAGLQQWVWFLERRIDGLAVQRSFGFHPGPQKL